MLRTDQGQQRRTIIEELNAHLTAARAQPGRDPRIVEHIGRLVHPSTIPRMWQV